MTAIPSTDRAPPDISIVAPCYNEVAGITEFVRRATAACRAVAGSNYEVVLVDDGSSDGTWHAIERLAATEAHVVGVRLMRNHGHQLAATAGLAVATGGLVMLIDADLQDPPELLGEMLEHIKAGADVVYGQRITRDGETWFKKATAAGFYRLLSRITQVPIPEDTGDFRVMRRRVVDALLAMPEQHRFLRGMVSWIGGRQIAFPYHRQGRHAGQSHYPLARMVRLAVDAVTAFSIAPLRIASWLGVAVAGVSTMLLGYSLWSWLIGDAVIGWTSTMAAITLFASVQLLVLGVIGEYLGRLVLEAKRRPLYLIDVVRRGTHDHELPAIFSSLPVDMQHSLLCRQPLPAPAVDIDDHPVRHRRHEEPQQIVQLS